MNALLHGLDAQENVLRLVQAVIVMVLVDVILQADTLMWLKIRFALEQALKSMQLVQR